MDLGVANLAAGEVDEGVAYCRRATELAPTEPAPWLNLGVALDTEAHYYEAELAYRKAIELGDTQATTQINLITNLLVQRRPKTADVALKQLLATNDSAAARTLRGDAMRMLSRPGEADQEYRAALKFDPQCYQALNGIAALQLSLYWANRSANVASRAAAVDLWQQSLAIRSPQPQVQALLKTYSK
jgi:Flp pilus assembly protein TadD